MPNVNLLPGVGFVQETDTGKVNLLPGGGFVAETFEGGGAPELTAGTATLGTVTYAEAQASATDATNGTPPYVYQWQLTERGDNVWIDLAGQTTLDLADTTVEPEAEYDYRLRYTDAAFDVVYSNTIEADIPAAPAPDPAEASGSRAAMSLAVSL